MCLDKGKIGRQLPGGHEQIEVDLLSGVERKKETRQFYDLIFLVGHEAY